MSQAVCRAIHEQETLSRRTIIKGGLAAVMVATTTVLTSRKSGAAVTSMDRAPYMQPFSTGGTPATGVKRER